MPKYNFLLPLIIDCCLRFAYVFDCLHLFIDNRAAIQQQPNPVFNLSLKGSTVLTFYRQDCFACELSWFKSLMMDLQLSSIAQFV